MDRHRSTNSRKNVLEKKILSNIGNESLKERVHCKYINSEQKLRRKSVNKDMYDSLLKSIENVNIKDRLFMYKTK